MKDKLFSKLNKEAIIYYGDHIYNTSALTREEYEIISGSVLKRKREFCTGRYFSHEALKELGKDNITLFKSQEGMPIWPDGIEGSISHCLHKGVVVVIRSDYKIFCGIDIECNKALPKEVERLIISKYELQQCMDLKTKKPNIFWETLIFSIKETMYKYWCNKLNYKLKPEECEIKLIANKDLFYAKCKLPNDNIEYIIGEFIIIDNHIITLVIK